MLNSAQINTRLRESAERAKACDLSVDETAACYKAECTAIREEMAKEAVEALSCLANSGFATAEDFVAEFKREHRTIQQGMFRLFMAVVEEYGADHFKDFDGRNESAVILSREIVEQIPHRHLPNV